MKPNWLVRDLVTLPYCYTLCTTAEMFQATQKRLGVLPHRRTMKFAGTKSGSGAQVSFFDADDFTNPKTKPAAICSIDGAFVVANFEPIQIAALLVHEAVHIWQAGARDMGEHEPSDEFEAYSIHRIAQALMYEFTDQMGMTK